MEATNLLSELGVSKWSVVWAYITDGGVWGVARKLCSAFSALLRRLPPDRLRSYADTASRIADILSYAISTFQVQGPVRDAADATSLAVRNLALHLADGEYSAQELQEDIDTVRQFIAAWRLVAAKPKKTPEIKIIPQNQNSPIDRSGEI